MPAKSVLFVVALISRLGSGVATGIVAGYGWMGACRRFSGGGHPSVMLSIRLPILLGFVFGSPLSRGRLVDRRGASCQDQPLSWPGGLPRRSLGHRSDPGSSLYI